MDRRCEQRRRKLRRREPVASRDGTPSVAVKHRSRKARPPAEGPHRLVAPQQQLQSLSARAKNAAIAPLVTGWLGQKRVLAALQPLVMPAAAMADMWFLKGLSTVSS